MKGAIKREVPVASYLHLATCEKTCGPHGQDSNLHTAADTLALDC